MATARAPARTREGRREAGGERAFLIAALAIAALLRIGNLGAFNHVDSDEMHWLQVGSSLLRTGEPTSWSIFDDAYRAAGVPEVDGSYTPALDHPPLFALAIGGWAVLIGEHDLREPRWARVRLPMIALSLLCLWATWRFARRLYGPRFARFSLLALAFLPSHVVTSRIIAVEHVTGLFLILGHDVLYRLVEEGGDDRSQRRREWGLIALCVAAPLMKLSAVAVPASLVFVALYRRQNELAGRLLMAFSASLAILFAYAWWQDWELFLNLLFSHGFRPQSFRHFWSIFTLLDVGHFPLFDASMIAGMIGVVALAAKAGPPDEEPGRGLYLAAPLLALSFVFLYVAPLDAYGWYKYVLYPFVALGLGFLFDALWRERVVALAIFLPLLAMALEAGGLVPNHQHRRYLVLASYALAALPLLYSRGPLRLRNAAMPLLCALFALEAWWATKVLGYWG